MAVEIYRPSPLIAQRYIDLLPRFRTEQDIASWAKDYALGHAGRCLWDARFLAGRNGRRRLLNIGGAPFLFEFALKLENPDLEIVSVDIEPDRFPGVGETLGISVTRGNVENSDWCLDQKFSCIVLAEVLEHLRIDILGTLKKIANHLDRDGFLFVTTPNGLSFGNIFRYFLHGRTGPSPIAEWKKLSNLGHMGHVREYSTVEIKEVLEHCGLMIEKLIYRDLQEGKWPFRDLLLSRRPQLAGEIVVVARVAS